jgi:hypothetical protein
MEKKLREWNVTMTMEGETAGGRFGIWQFDRPKL